jgi:uncharacterized protein YcbK (DUF882 family)
LARQGTREEVRVPFCRDGYHVYTPGYRALCWILRDHQVDPAAGYVNFSVDTIEALWEIQQTIIGQGINRPLTITSGYRTPETNSRLDRAVHKSQHLHATAVDMYVEGISMRQLFNDCYSRAISGGIGYYDDHVHLDTGPRRYWVGQVDAPRPTVDLADVGALAGRRILLV